VISIIIPTLNEEDLLPTTLLAVSRQTSEHEMIIVDGGSTDETVRVAERFGCKILNSAETNRGLQMNLGVKAATGETLLFLHADTLLPEGALRSIERCDPKCIGGAFRRRFDSPSRILLVTCYLADFRGALLGWFLGDSAIFVNRNVFDKIGGYRDLSLLEDLDLALRMKKEGPVVLLNPVVISSARRFRDGVFKTILTDSWLMIFFWMRGARE